MKPTIAFVNLLTVPLPEIHARISGKGELYQPISMPLGIMYLSSYIKKYNMVGTVGLIDYVVNYKYLREHRYQNIDEYISYVAKNAINFTPDIIAISLIFSSSVHFFTLCLKEFKSIWPNAVCIAGGTHATAAFKTTLKDSNVDYVIRGEGEIAFSEFIKQFSNFKKIQINGVYTKKDLENTYRDEKSNMVDNLDDIPYPDRELINIEEYILEKGRTKNIAKAINSKTASILTSRGCPFNCTFCSSHAVHGRKIRFRSIENIILEVKSLYDEYNVNLFIPEDDLFIANKDRLINMLTAFRGLHIPDFGLQFPNALRVNDLDEEIIDALFDTGLRVAIIAIESGSEYVLKKIIKKSVDLKKAKDAVSYFKGKGIIIRCYFILGFPGETKELMCQTIEYARNLQADWSTFIIATPLVGSEMYDQFVKAGVIQEDFYLNHDSTFNERQFDTPEISADDLNELAYRSNLEINFLNNYNKASGRYEKAIALYQDILDVYPFHVIGWYCVMECYRLMGDHGKAAEVKEKINNLIASDERAYKMHSKYHDLIPNL